MDTEAPSTAWLLWTWLLETLLHCWWECELVQPLWKTVWRFLKELRIDLPYDPAIALLGIYPKDTDAMKRRDTCTPMFLAAMSTIAKLEGASVSSERWMDKEDVVYVYNGILLSHWKWQIPSICFDVDGTGGYYAEWNKSIGEGKTLYGLIHLGNIKIVKGNKGERRKNEWEISKRETEHERLLTLGNELLLSH